jgi:hypothetical protein
MKHRAPQPDFKFADEPFALVSETEADVERLKREQEKREQDQRESEAKQITFNT